MPKINLGNKTQTHSQRVANWKKSHPDVIGLFRFGDFYEAFGDDAKDVAKVLAVNFTTRQFEGEELAMVGFPHQYLEAYLRKLLAAKLKVAILDKIA